VPFSSGVLFNETDIPKGMQRPVGCLRFQPRVRALCLRDPSSDHECVAAKGADPLGDEFVTGSIGSHRGGQPDCDKPGIDTVGAIGDGSIMGLLGDEHRRSRMPFSHLDQLGQCVAVDRTAVFGEPAGQTHLPVVDVDRTERVEPTELVQGPVTGGEEVPHEMFEAPGEETGDPVRILKDGSHLLRQGVRITIGSALAGDLLELVDEEHQLAIICNGDALREPQREREVPVGIPTGDSRPKGQLHLVTELGLQASRCRQRRADQGGPPCPPGSRRRPPQGGTVSDRLDDQRLGQLGPVRDPEEIQLDNIEAASTQTAKDRPAHTGLAGPPRAGDYSMDSVAESSNQIGDIALSTNQPIAGDGPVGGKEIPAALPRHAPHNKAYHAIL
jgi:hypothetical protein